MPDSSRTLLLRFALVVAAGQGIALVVGLFLVGTGAGGLVATVIIGAASILVGLMIIARRMSSHAQTVSTVAERLAQGDFDARVSEVDAGELSPVAASLNEMATALDQRMQQVESARQEQQAILQSMSNGVIALDAGQRVLRINRAAELLLGLAESRARGRLIQEVLRQPELHRLADDAIAGRSTAATELSIEGTTPVTVRAVAETLRRADGTAEGGLIVLNDVTQLRRLESMRSDFAANVSHELRTPITNIRGYAETLLDVGWEDDAQATSFLQIIRKNSERLASIVEDVLSLAKFERPETKQSLDRECVRVAVIIGAAVTQIDMAAVAKNIAIESAVDATLTASVQPRMIEQAVSNLLSNAVAYSAAGTTVCVTGRAVGATLMIAVADQGPGIAPEHQERIFERFYRADKARSRDLGGTGLGLAIVKHIAILHGGYPEVESEIGHGSTFRLILPDAIAIAGATRSLNSTS